jgi:hypothetical protein
MLSVNGGCRFAAWIEVIVALQLEPPPMVGMWVAKKSLNLFSEFE